MLVNWTDHNHDHDHFRNQQQLSVKLNIEMTENIAIFPRKDFL